MSFEGKRLNVAYSLSLGLLPILLAMTSTGAKKHDD